MPRAKKENKQPAARQNTFNGFLNIKLSDEEFDVIDGITPTMSVGETLKWAADFGKVSISYNDKNDTYNATITFVGGRLDKFAISSFSDDPIEALAITVFKTETYHDTVDLTGKVTGSARRG